MSLRSKKISWRYIGVALLSLALIATTALSLAARTGTANASKVRKVNLGPAKTTQLTAIGSVDWSKLPVVAANAKTATGRPVLTDRDRMTTAQRAAYFQSLKQHKIAAPQAKAQPAPIGAPSAAQIAQNANPNFDACGYLLYPCQLHSFAGQNSTQAGGWYPPDQAIASNPTYVMEGNNNVFSVYSFSGSVVYGPTSSFSFFGPLIHGSDFLSDPEMFWDATRLHWIIVEIEIATDSSGNVTGDYYDIGISKNQNATVNAPSQWYLYQFNANVNVGGASNWCDYPTLGGDYWGIWLDCVAFQTGASEPFLGNAVFALNKNALYTGSNSVVDFWTQIPTGISCGSGCFNPAYRLSSVNQDGTADAEFLIATDAGYGGPFSDLTTCAFSNTRGLVTGTIPTASCVINTLPVSYTDPINAVQPGLGNSVYPGIGTKEIMYKGGNLYFALTTAVNSGTDDGVYWAEVQPQLTQLNPSNPGAQTVQNTLIRQAGIYAYSAGNDAYMPTFMGSSEDDEVLVFNYSTSSIYPTIVDTGRRATDALGYMGPGGQFISGVNATNPNGSGRWGDYSGCSLDTNLTSRGIIWCGGEYGGPHASSSGTGWDTWIYALQVE
jgi:hypothetical protein